MFYMKTLARFTVSLSPELAQYAEEVRQRLGVSRSEVFALALQRLRESELREGYRALAEDPDFREDPWVDSGLRETLEESPWS